MYTTNRFHVDYTEIAYQLMTCLSNIEQQDEVYKLLRHIQKYNFQNEGNIQTYCFLAWTVHRCRFYTSSKYNFLKNSVNENEALAQRFLDSAMLKINRDKGLNQFFQPEFIEAQKQSVYHYRAILYSYTFQMDSARKYYKLMQNFPYFSHNNYAIFLNVDGDFKNAAKEFEQASYQSGGDKRLQEWAYYGSMIDIYKSQPDKAATEMRDMIKAVGSTPGYGWYNIALARALSYDGNIEESNRYLTKAEGFKEIHIGTTLGQSHYDFSINLVKLHNAMNHIAALKFEHKNWWYNPKVILQLAKENATLFLLQYLVVNQFAMNPERDNVIYKLFSSESTIAWDEVWYLIKDFSTNFFLKKYENEIQNNKQRPKIQRYFQLFVAKLEIEKGNHKTAKKLLEQILQTPDLDAEYEKLFIARTYEALATSSKALDQQSELEFYTNQFYSIYPQLVPYSGLKVAFNIRTNGVEDKTLMKHLKATNISINPSSPLTATLSFGQEGKKKNISCVVVNRDGKTIVAAQKYAYANAEEAALKTAYRLFNMGEKKTLDDDADIDATHEQDSEADR